MNHARIIVATGTAFPAGVMLGGTIGALFGNIVFAIVCCILLPAPVTVFVFWRTTRDVDWDWRLERRAYARVLTSAFIATGVVIAAMWLWVSAQNSALIFLALPLGSALVTLRTKSAMAGVA